MCFPHWELLLISMAWDRGATEAIWPQASLDKGPQNFGITELFIEMGNYGIKELFIEM